MWCRPISAGILRYRQTGRVGRMLHRRRGGISGLGTGARLTQRGLRVIVVEKYRGLFAVGNIGSGFHGVDYPLLLNGNSHRRCLVQVRAAADVIAEIRES